jgi:hypothetical protein
MKHHAAGNRGANDSVAWKCRRLRRFHRSLRIAVTIRCGPDKRYAAALAPAIQV